MQGLSAVLWFIVVLISAVLPAANIFNVRIVAWVWWGSFVAAALAFKLLERNNRKFPKGHFMLSATLSIAGFRYAVVYGLSGKLVALVWVPCALSCVCCAGLVIIGQRFLGNHPFPWCALVVMVGQAAHDLVAVYSTEHVALTLPFFICACIPIPVILLLWRADNCFSTFLAGEPVIDRKELEAKLEDVCTLTWVYRWSSLWMLYNYAYLCSAITSGECSADGHFFAQWFGWLVICLMLLLVAASSAWLRNHTCLGEWC